MHYFGLFLNGHWTSFVTQTWQPWCRADTFRLEWYHMFPTELNYFSFYKHAKRQWGRVMQWSDNVIRYDQHSGTPISLQA